VLHNRRRILVGLLLATLFAAGLAHAEPGKSWERVDPAAAGLSTDAVKAAEDYVAAQKPTAFLIAKDGKRVAGWGDPSRKVSVASVRKSLISSLYGIAVAEGRIRLDATLEQLDIDDKAPSLSEAEKQATVADLLKARSGIYHTAAHETADIRRKRPARGSHAPGSFWFYNNWDFNALGTIYRNATGENIFASFAARIAQPIGMEDFSAGDGSYATEPSSIHPAYPFRMSARDLARFGLLFLNGGRWNGRQIVSGGWVTESTSPYSHTARGNLGYGYLWWTLRPEMFGPGAAMASGYRCQLMAFVPSKRLVVVQTNDRGAGSDQGSTSRFVALLNRIAAGTR
jgi:CubicO group peptidase (beta-lactamase class C family)